MNGPDPDYIADTSAVIRLLRRDRLAEQRLQGKTFATTFVTMAELDLGILKADNPIAAAYRCKEVLEGVQVLHGSSMTPWHYACIYHDLEKRGARIPVNDIWIAAIALETGLPVLARDKHFSRVRGVSVVQC
ncbi:MAG: type II toxin-antitoxin system VapC family toxin [Limisphaerales bacterium]